MKKYSIWYFISITLVACSLSSFNGSILRQLSYVQEDHYKVTKSGHPLNLKTLSSLRQQVFHIVKDSIDLNQSEFFFVLEAYSIEDGSYLGRFWNKKFDVRYSKKIGSEIEVFTKYDPSQNALNIFFDDETNYMCSLIENWDTNAIKKMSAESKVLGGLNYLASYISNVDGKFRIQCLSFYEFSLENKHR